MSITTLQRIGWGYLILLLGLFVYLGLINFLVYLLFVYLVSDLLTSFLQWRFPFLPSKLALYLTYLLISSIAIIIIFYIIPNFVGDLPKYAHRIERAINTELSPYLQKFGWNIELQSIKTSLIVWFKQNFVHTFTLIQKIGKNIFLFVLSIIINFIIQYQGLDKTSDTACQNLLQYISDFTYVKVRSFYHYFKSVMTAQLFISLINSVLTLGMLFVLNIPHKLILTVFVFIFGLLPIIGNIISNTLICSAAIIWTGLWQFVAALIFLVVIHKLEYILNGKIIGHIVQLPMHIILLALITGETLFHISGMIIAVPFVLFLREQLSLTKLQFDKPMSTSST